MAAGSFTLLEELFAAGAAEFLAEIRRVHHGERLGGFAARWFEDKRPVARQFIFDYLDQPLNCYRHEALVKRLFKIAEKAGDDEVMGMFLVAFDRCVRKQRKSINRSKYESFESQAAALKAQTQWVSEGYSQVTINKYGQRYQTFATKFEEVVVTPAHTTMPRPSKGYQKRDAGLNDGQRAKYERKYTLFSVVTRKYLRRRAWRYFRNLGKADPERFLRAATQFLLCYRDADIDSDIHLLDNWGLMNALFHGCTALEFKRQGCMFAAGKSMADLRAAPRFESAWNTRPEALFTLMIEADCRAVRHWAYSMISMHHEAWLEAQPVERLLLLIDSHDETVVALGFEFLEDAKDLGSIPVEQWLRRLDGDDLGTLTRLSEFLRKHLDPARVSPEAAIQLAMHRSRPVAGVGYSIVKSKVWNDPGPLLALVNAECDSIRHEMIPWLRSVIQATGPIRSEVLIEWLDSRHADVRDEGWKWFESSVAQIDDTLFAKLAESPYDDIRLRLVAAFKIVVLNYPDMPRLHLWGSVLTNIHRGGRQKPGVVQAIVNRIGDHPAEAESLLPMLGIAVRSLRGPEFRAGLAGLVRIANMNPELQSRVQTQFPEFTLGG